VVEGVTHNRREEEDEEDEKVDEKMDEEVDEEEDEKVDEEDEDEAAPMLLAEEWGTVEARAVEPLLEEDAVVELHQRRLLGL